MRLYSWSRRPYASYEVSDISSFPSARDETTYKRSGSVTKDLFNLLDRSLIILNLLVHIQSLEILKNLFGLSSSKL
jgi:hypothetical protein